MDGVLVEEVGQVARGREAPRLSVWLGRRRGPEVSGQRPHEGVVKVLVDQLQQGPDRALGRPGVGVGAGPAGTVTTGTVRSAPSPPTAVMVAAIKVPGNGKSILAQTPSLSPVPRGPEAVGKALGQPALDPSGGDGDDLARHGVGQRLGAVRPPERSTRWSARADRWR